MTNSMSMELDKLKPKAPILIFDIETVPDIPLVMQVYGKEEPSTNEQPSLANFGDGNVTSFLEANFTNLSLAQGYLDTAGIKFPAPMFHSVVSICAIFVHPETFCIMDGFRKSVPLASNYKKMLEDERKLLKQFWDFMLKYQDFSAVWYDTLQSDYRLSDFQRKKLKPIPVTLCGYNISGFDLPVLEQRSIRALITCPFHDYVGDAGYDSYRSRFAPDKTFDLCQYIAGTGQTKSSLEAVSRAIGLGGKMQGMDGSRVAHEYYQNAAWEKIEEYCAVDVLVTYGVFLAVQKFRGFVSDKVFASAIEHFEKFLRQDGKPPSYAELANCSQQFFAFKPFD